jgi:hypothetical protein
VAVPEAPAHRAESAPRPDLGLLELLRGLSGGVRLPEPGTPERRLERRLASVLARELPERRARASDVTDLETLALALPRCRLVTCDATMADVVHRSGLDVRFCCELFTGRRADVERLRDRLAGLMGEPFRAGPPGYGPGEEGGRDRMATNVDRETELPEDAAGARTDDDEAEEDGGVARLSLPGTWEEE